MCLCVISTCRLYLVVACGSCRILSKMSPIVLSVFSLAALLPQVDLRVSGYGPPHPLHDPWYAQGPRNRYYPSTFWSFPSPRSSDPRMRPLCTRDINHWDSSPTHPTNPCISSGVVAALAKASPVAPASVWARTDSHAPSLACVSSTTRALSLLTSHSECGRDACGRWSLHAPCKLQAESGASDERVVYSAGTLRRCSRPIWMAGTTSPRAQTASIA